MEERTNLQANPPMPPVESVKRRKAPMLMIIGVVVVILGVSFIFFNRKTNEQITPQEQSQSSAQVLTATEEVLENIQAQEYSGALEHFIHGEIGEPTDDEITASLQGINELYVQPATTTPHASNELIRVKDNRAQALVEFTLPEGRSTIRFDYVLRPSGWKILEVKPGSELDL